MRDNKVCILVSVEIETNQCSLILNPLCECVSVKIQIFVFEA